MSGILLSKNLLTLLFYVKQLGDARKQEIHITEDGDTLKIIGGKRKKVLHLIFLFTILGFKRLH